MNFKKFNRLSELNQNQWLLFFQQLRHKIPFLDFNWLNIWCKNFIDNQSYCVFTFLDNENGIVGVFPLYAHSEIQTGIKYKGFSFTANSHSFRTQFLVHPQYKSEVISLWLDILFKDERFDYVKFKEFLLDEEILKHLKDKKIKFSLEEEKRPPFIDLNGDWNKYFSSLRGHFRRNLRRRLRNAEKEFGKVEYREFSGNDDQLEAFVLEGLKLEASGWKGKHGSAILNNEQVKQFYFDIAHTFFKTGQLHLGAVYFADQMVAFNFSIIYDNVFYLLKVAYDEKVAKFSPGQIMIYLLLQELFKQQIRRFDFLGPAMPWKLEWTSNFNRHFTLYIYGNTFKAHFLYLLNSKILPFLRNIKFIRKLKEKIA